MQTLMDKDRRNFLSAIKLLLITYLALGVSGCESLVSFNRIGYLPPDYKLIVESSIKPQLVNPSSAKFEYPFIPKPGIIENRQFQTYSGWIGVVKVHGTNRDGIPGKSTFQFCISQGKIIKLDNASSNSWRYKAEELDTRWQYLVNEI